ncbi:MAG: hypothetical protein QOD44_1792 [Solirubrobacteraceae bacterium]|nr:hypothetical protein [Solirubrobacteraceae bacterium]
MADRTMDHGRAVARKLRRLGGQAGQGTVEYVALMLLVAAIMGTVVLAGGRTKGETISGKLTTQIGKAIEDAGDSDAK